MHSSPELGVGPTEPAVAVSRRRLGLAGALAFCGILSWAGRGVAGSYLDRASILVHSSKQELSYLRSRLYDQELARLTQRLAAARSSGAAKMLVPREVVQAHPHLLLMLENYERAANAAVERKPKEFLKFLGLARDEEQLFRAVLKQLGWSLPEFRA